MHEYDRMPLTYALAKKGVVYVRTDITSRKNDTRVPSEQ
jgi:hypothetical protein